MTEPKLASFCCVLGEFFDFPLVIDDGLFFFLKGKIVSQVNSLTTVTNEPQFQLEGHGIVPQKSPWGLCS